MQKKKIIYTFIVLSICLTVIFGLIIYKATQNKLAVYFLDIGQGDAILISQNGNQILIDSGPSGRAIMEKLGKYIPFWDRTIEIVLATHPDSDHIGGFPSVFENYKIGAVIESNVLGNSALYEEMEKIIKNKNIKKIEGRKGIKVRLSGNSVMEILNSKSANLADQKDANSNSLVSKLVWENNNSFLFLGDLPAKQEKELVSKVSDLSSDVLKIAHHGSKYSTSIDILEAVKPRDAIISAGKNNRYGHPAPEVLEKLKNRSINIFRTDEKGDIIYTCQKLLSQSVGQCQVNFSFQ